MPGPTFEPSSWGTSCSTPLHMVPECIDHSATYIDGFQWKALKVLKSKIILILKEHIVTVIGRLLLQNTKKRKQSPSANLKPKLF